LGSAIIFLKTATSITRGRYIAFGEVLFENTVRRLNLIYLFNRKELDRTNLSYYGARYLDIEDFVG
jgi:hypothetical protein